MDRRLRWSLLAPGLGAGAMLLLLEGCASSSGAYRSRGYTASQSPRVQSDSASTSSLESVEESAQAAMAPVSASTGGDSGGSDDEGGAPPPAPPEPSDAPPAPPPAPSPPGGPARAAPPPARTAPAPRGPAGPTRPATPRGQPPAQPGQPVQAATPAPMLLYTADVHMTAERTEITALLDRITDLAYSLGGYLVQRSNTMVRVRIPSARFREGVGRVEGMGDVLQRSINADDVSEEFHDLQVRLANLQAVRQRLEQFLARANNVAEALQVERELERVAGEIDRIQGRMRFLSSRAAFSLVTVQVSPRSTIPLPIAPVVPPRRLLNLPVPWLDRLGLGHLLQVR